MEPPNETGSSFTKFAPPPTILEQEAQLKNLSMPETQKQIMIDKLLEKALEKSDDETEKKILTAMRVKRNRGKMEKQIEEYFVEDFINWLQGKSRYNQPKVTSDFSEDGIERDGTPWGDKPLTFLPDVQQFLGQFIDNRHRVAHALTVLKSRVPENINEAWLYYKYIVRGFGLDENGITELRQFDIMHYPGYDGMSKRKADGETMYDRVEFDMQGALKGMTRTVKGTQYVVSYAPLYGDPANSYSSIRMICDNAVTLGMPMPEHAFNYLTDFDKVYLTEKLRITSKTKPDVQNIQQKKKR